MPTPSVVRMTRGAYGLVAATLGSYRQSRKPSYALRLAVTVMSSMMQPRQAGLVSRMGIDHDIGVEYHRSLVGKITEGLANKA